ncbi:MAG: hypothetical protein ABSH53_13650 [Holophaga sp.]|jgi:hypothetical protein
MASTSPTAAASATMIWLARRFGIASKVTRMMATARMPWAMKAWGRVAAITTVIVTSDRPHRNSARS